jgi:hypothetical protein
MLYERHAGYPLPRGWQSGISEHSEGVTIFIGHLGFIQQRQQSECRTDGVMLARVGISPQPQGVSLENLCCTSRPRVVQARIELDR